MARIFTRYRGTGSVTHAVQGAGTTNVVLYTVPTGKVAQITWGTGANLGYTSVLDYYHTSCDGITGAVDVNSTIVLDVTSMRIFALDGADTAWGGSYVTSDVIKTSIGNRLQGVSTKSHGAGGVGNPTGLLMPILIAGDVIQFTVYLPDVSTEGFDYKYNFNVIEEDI
jgi:hypothetical protein